MSFKNLRKRRFVTFVSVISELFWKSILCFHLLVSYEKFWIWFILQLKAKLLQETWKEYSSLPPPPPSLFASSFVIHFICFLLFIIHPNFFTKHILLRTSSDFEYENWITLPHFFAIKQDSKHTSKIKTLSLQYMQFIVKLYVFKLEFTPYNLNLVMWTKFDPQVFNLIYNNSTPSLRHGDVLGIRLKPNIHACNPVLMNKGIPIMFFAIWCIIFLFLLKLILWLKWLKWVISSILGITKQIFVCVWVCDHDSD